MPNPKPVHTLTRGYVESEETEPAQPKTIAGEVRKFLRALFGALVVALALSSCGDFEPSEKGCKTDPFENYVTRNLGGSQTITLEKGQRLVEITFKRNDLWILTEPMDSDYVPKTKTFYEDSNYGIMEGKITIVEQR